MLHKCLIHPCTHVQICLSICSAATYSAEHSLFKFTDDVHSFAGSAGTVFAVITANPTEEKAVRHFLQLGGKSGEVWEGASECIWKNDPYLKSNNVTVTDRGVDRDYGYELFTLTREGETEEVLGVHIKCQQQAAFTKEGAQDTATALLQRAKKWKWKLEHVFSVGCCGYAADGKDEENLMGYVLLANEFEAYLNRGKMGEDLKHHPEVYASDVKWISDLQDHRITKPGRQSSTDGKFKDIPIKVIPRIESGPLVVKSNQYAEKLCGISYRVGIEMEAVGFIKAIQSYEKQENQNIPKFVLVKGISDFGSGKSDKAETTFFGQKTAALSDGERQQVATLHSIALVIRGVVERYLVPRPVVNLG